MDVKTCPKTESGSQLFARLNSRPSIANIEPLLFETVLAGDIIEISGEAGCGKTEFLYRLIVQCIFPNSWKGIHLGGLNAGVVFIDNDYHFTLFRLINIMETKILYLKSLKERCGITAVDISQLITDRLRLLHVIKCVNTEQLLITLHSLENMLATNSQISCIMIDSISAFYWIDRMNAMHQLRKLDDLHLKVVLSLKKLMDNYKLAIFATKQKLMKKSGTTTGDEYDFMGRHWQKYCKQIIELSLERTEKEKTLMNISYIRGNVRTLRKCAITDAGIVL